MRLPNSQSPPTPRARSLRLRLALWLALPLAVGALCSVPLSAIAVKKIKARPLTIAIGILTTALGIFTLLKTYVF